MKTNKETLFFAFKQSIPVMTGYIFLGLSYGIYARVSGLPFYYPFLTSVLIFGGSLEFVSVAVMLAKFSPLSSFFMALVLQARHLFYGLSMLKKYEDIHGIQKFCMIFDLSDETFSVNYSIDIPKDYDCHKVWHYIGALDRLYWISASTAGGILGGLITFNTNGIDFVMTALFVVIFLDQLLKEKDHTASIIGVICSVGCLLIFGPSSFIIPAMISMLVLLILFEKKIGGYY